MESEVSLTALCQALGQAHSHWGGFDHHDSLKKMRREGKLQSGDTELLRVSLKSHPAYWSQVELEKEAAGV